MKINMAIIKRKRLILPALVLLMVFALAMLSGCAKEGSRGILYKVQNKGVTVYLLGSIHVGTEEMYPFGETIQAAMEASQTFVFECDTQSPQAIADTQSMLHYTDGTLLADAVSAEVYDKLVRACEKEGMPVTAFRAMRPWAAMTQFSLQVMAAEMGFANVTQAIRRGVENEVRSYAAAREAQWAYLETAREQLAVLDQMSMPLQEYLLDGALSVVLDPSAVRGMDATMSDWPGWWRDGNIGAFVDNYQASYFDASAGEPEATLLKEYHQALVARRNLTMADSIEGYLKGQEPRTYFVTVGLLHLVLPEDSIVKHLQNRGYAVECLSQP